MNASSATSGLNRREFGLGASVLALASVTRADPSAAVEATLSVRLLETSDLHVYILDWDYYHAESDPKVGLAKAATLVDAARREAANCLLFDNGDFLQGSPLGDYAASHPLAPHPMLAAMSALGYDAATIGNHEFNFGLPFLEASIAGSLFPFVLANVTRAGGAPFLPPFTILERRLKDDAGVERTLRVGVIGFTPPQILEWDKARLAGKLEASDIVAAARRYVPEMREKCDLVVALSHSGISAAPYQEGMENASYHLAGVPGVDVIFTGHSHRVFPGKDYLGRGEAIDAVAGKINGVPTVMPGFWGDHLGLVDLRLALEGGKWRVVDSRVEARPIYRMEGGKAVALVGSDAKVAASVAAAHAATLTWVEQPVGALDAPLHSYFVWTGFDPATALVNAAQLEYARARLPRAYADLPLLSAAAPFRAGYTPDDFVDIAAGPVALRQVADLYVYGGNTVAAVKATGAQILEWLEFSARVFAEIDPASDAPQPLRDRYVPAYNFDVIAGLSYEIDVTRPARYDAKGGLTASARRIRELRFQGEPIDPRREFVVVTNNYRADGGGGFPALRDAAVVLRAPDSNRDAVLAFLRGRQSVSPARSFPWRLASPNRPLTLTFDSGRKAAARIGDVPGLTLAGEGEPGYLRLAYRLG